MRTLHWQLLTAISPDPSCLSPLEIARLQYSAQADRFLRSRTFLRQVLGHYLSLPPPAVPISYAPSGKPILANLPFYFNLAHSGDWLVVAVSDCYALGIDLEEMKVRPYQQLINRYFCPTEQQWLREQSSLGESFYRAWVGKEAYSKLLELPLLQVLRQLETISLLQEGRMAVAGGIIIQEIVAPLGYRAALAYRTL
ncbi:MAG: 4'-phosphopantetheinyl transferase superfamily protein [Pseudanabaenaceae cyanobacterium SKYGB_i_bin29]|nr:4'-phosphopantetheinyl transferase superfamily protein [Pseudanabaenaceae cyanobacterium SKYG29]MDW8420617.1 4'-phosphopantetheinyl transferase superfamily protein [Pseudanabaenaceae cyanobacterium SKYGB_i_bin29]